MTPVLGIPTIEADVIRGVDWSAPAERVQVGGLVEALGFRVNRYGNLRSMEGLDFKGLTFTGDYVVGGMWYRKDDVLVVASVDTTNIEMEFDTVARGLTGTVTAIGTLSMVTNRDEPVTMEELNEIVFIASHSQGLHSWDGATFSSVHTLSGRETDLNDDSTHAALQFRGISKFDGHLIGYGYGDESGGSGEETGLLGIDRPEILRWSHLGQPIKWRPENWIMVGTRGNPILSAHPAYGRLAVLKPEGVFLLWGSLEQNLPQLEQLREDSGRATGAVGPNAAAVMDGDLYWLSPAGPMRWRGGPTVEYLGRPVEDSLTGDFRSSMFFVLPAPEIEAVLYCSPINAPGPSFSGVPGSGTPAGTSSDELYVWVWDAVEDRWEGRFKVPAADQVRSGFVAPDAAGKFRSVFAADAELQDDSNAKTGLAGSQCKTPDVELNDGAPAVLRGFVLEGEWAAMDGYFDIDVLADGVSAMNRRLFVASATPTANQVGDLWYDTANRYSLRWDGSAWVIVAGIPEGRVRLPLSTRCRTAQAVIDWTGTTTAVKQTIRNYGFQARPL